MAGKPHQSLQGRGPVQVVTPDDLPAPGGHYSYAVVANGMVHISGLLPIDDDGKPMATANFDDQAKRVLNNLQTVLAAAETSTAHLVHVRVYLASVDDWGRFNTLYAAWIGEHRPARAIVPTPGLHYGLSLEIEALAVTDSR